MLVESERHESESLPLPGRQRLQLRNMIQRGRAVQLELQLEVTSTPACDHAPAAGPLACQ
jgi:hypothetical protein